MRMKSNSNLSKKITSNWWSFYTLAVLFTSAQQEKHIEFYLITKVAFFSAMKHQKISDKCEWQNGIYSTTVKMTTPQFVHVLKLKKK